MPDNGLPSVPFLVSGGVLAIGSAALFSQAMRTKSEFTLAQPGDLSNTQIEQAREANHLFFITSMLTGAAAAGSLSVGVAGTFQ